MIAALTSSLLLFGAPSAHATSPGLSDPSALELHEGKLIIKEDGTVVENLEITGTLRIEAEDVVVRNVWVYTSDQWSIYVASGSATFDHIEVGHPDVIGQRGIGGSNVRVRYADIHHVEDGIKLGSNAIYSNVHVHDLASLSADPHADAVQVEGTAIDSAVWNSILDATGPVGNGNAAVIIKSDIGPQSGLRFSANYLNGGAYMVFVRDGGNGIPSDITFSGNRIGPDYQFNLVSSDGPIEWTNNRLASTGELVDTNGEVIGPAPPTTTTTMPATTTTSSTTTTTMPATTTTDGDDVASGPSDGSGIDGAVIPVAVMGAAALAIGAAVLWRRRTSG